MIVAQLATLLPLVLSAAAAPPPNYEKLDLPAVIAAIPELSHIHEQLQRYPKSNLTLSHLNNVTVFLGKGAYPTNLDYTIVDGLHPSSSFSNNKTFLHTHLVNPKYSIVTGGQVLEVQKRNDGRITVVGGVRNNRTVVAKIIKPDIRFKFGLLHILNTPVPPPASSLETAYALNLTTLTTPTAAKILKSDENLHDITRVFVQGNWSTYLSNLVQKLTPEQAERVENGNLVKGEVVYSTLFAKQEGNVTTANKQGDKLAFREGNSLEVNGVKVTRPDILVSNGVLHALARPAFPYGFVPPVPEPIVP